MGERDSDEDKVGAELTRSIGSDLLDLAAGVGDAGVDALVSGVCSTAFLFSVRS